ncbi:c-type cytochrome [Marinobacterium lutimaris]|uniref:Cytochrome c, mono-and diheme variants n=1 Tax=Marinobacterium lutimaris TaxID=568106 RepID=A0A1H5X2F0_9GAMM|nr:cytochrome c [Marinobacterium lutimaris]SEG05545.1 Cytochrome c, mono-and diheme variants [Marinobacterium lutimaris]
MPLLRLLSLVILTGLFGCSSEPDPANQDGKELYSYYCAGCHNESGDGSFLQGIPANNRTEFAESELVDVIRTGHPDLPDMPHFSQLSRMQASAIAQYLHRQLKK